jgi:hypothetical protein
MLTNIFKKYNSMLTMDDNSNSGNSDNSGNSTLYNSNDVTKYYYKLCNIICEKNYSEKHLELVNKYYKEALNYEKRVINSNKRHIKFKDIISKFQKIYNKVKYININNKKVLYNNKLAKPYYKLCNKMCKCNASNNKLTLVNSNYKTFLRISNNLSDKDKNQYIHNYNKLYKYYHWGGAIDIKGFTDINNKCTFTIKDIENKDNKEWIESTQDLDLKTIEIALHKIENIQNINQWYYARPDLFLSRSFFNNMVMDRFIKVKYSFLLKVIYRTIYGNNNFFELIHAVYNKIKSIPVANTMGRHVVFDSLWWNESKIIYKDFTDTEKNLVKTIFCEKEQMIQPNTINNNIELEDGNYKRVYLKKSLFTKIDKKFFKLTSQYITILDKSLITSILREDRKKDVSLYNLNSYIQKNYTDIMREIIDVSRILTTSYTPTALHTNPSDADKVKHNTEKERLDKLKTDNNLNKSWITFLKDTDYYLKIFSTTIDIFDTNTLELFYNYYKKNIFNDNIFMNKDNSLDDFYNKFHNNKDLKKKYNDIIEFIIDNIRNLLETDINELADSSRLKLSTLPRLNGKKKIDLGTIDIIISSEFSIYNEYIYNKIITDFLGEDYLNYNDVNYTDIDDFKQFRTDRTKEIINIINTYLYTGLNLVFAINYSYIMDENFKNQINTLINPNGAPGAPPSGAPPSGAPPSGAPPSGAPTPGQPTPSPEPPTPPPTGPPTGTPTPDQPTPAPYQPTPEPLPPPSHLLFSQISDLRKQIEQIRSDIRSINASISKTGNQNVTNFANIINTLTSSITALQHNSNMGIESIQDSLVNTLQPLQEKTTQIIKKSKKGGRRNHRGGGYTIDKNNTTLYSIYKLNNNLNNFIDKYKH